MIGIDLKLPIDLGRNAFSKFLKGLANVHWTNRFLATIRFSSQETIRQVRWQTRRQSSNQNLFLFRSISLHGLCADNLSSKPSRHRKLSSSNAAETLSLWHSWNCITKYIGKCKRTSRLENLRGLRTNSDKQSPRTLRRRRLRHSTGSRSLCIGFNNHRFMSFTISMGKISQAQSRGQGTYTDGLKGLYTHVYPHYRRKSPRCQYSRRLDFRAWRHLHNGSRLPRLRSSLYVHSKPFNIYYKSQKQFRLPPSLLSESRQDNRSSMRPNDNAQRILRIAGLPCCSSSNRLLRHQYKQEIYLSNKQLCTACLDDCKALQVPLADRNLFQMDQAIPLYQNFFWHDRERRKDSNLDCHQHLRFDRHCQERTQNQAEFRRNLANSQHCTFRESSYYTSTYENYVAKQKCSVS